MLSLILVVISVFVPASVPSIPMDSGLSLIGVFEVFKVFSIVFLVDLTNVAAVDLSVPVFVVLPEVFRLLMEVFPEDVVFPSVVSIMFEFGLFEMNSVVLVISVLTWSVVIAEVDKN